MKSLCLLFLICGSAFGQFELRPMPPKSRTTRPNNNYGDWPQESPDGLTIHIGGYSYLVNEDGSQTPVSGRVWNLTGYWTQASGYHAHESGANALWRPVPVADSYDRATGADGTVGYTIKFPPISGWFTIEFVVFGGGPPATTQGANQYFGFSPEYITYQYLSSTTSALTQSDQRNDLQHSGKGYALEFFLQDLIHDGLAKYIADTGDYITMERASLPSGGMLDDQYFGGTWSVPLNEEHGYGFEFDAVNPQLPTMASQFQHPERFSALVSDLVSEGCHLGVNYPSSSGSIPGDRTLWWSAQASLHFVCADFLRPRPIGQGSSQ